MHTVRAAGAPVGVRWGGGVGAGVGAAGGVREPSPGLFAEVHDHDKRPRDK